MKCSQFQQLIDAYLDNELSSNLRLEFDAHRVQCDECQRWLTMVEAVTNTVCDDRDVPALSGDFTARVLASTSESENARPRTYVWRLWTAGAAALQAAAVLTWVILQPATLTTNAIENSVSASLASTSALAPVDAAAVMPVALNAEAELLEATVRDRAMLADSERAIAAQDETALIEIVYTELENHVERLDSAGRSVSTQTQQLVNFLHLSLDVDDNADTICEVPTVDPFSGLLDAVRVLAEDHSLPDQTDVAGDRFQL